MPVFDFNATPDEKKPAECTYTVIRSNVNGNIIPAAYLPIRSRGHHSNFSRKTEP